MDRALPTSAPKRLAGTHHCVEQGCDVTLPLPLPMRDYPDHCMKHWMEKTRYENIPEALEPCAVAHTSYIGSTIHPARRRRNWHLSQRIMTSWLRNMLSRDAE